MTKFNLDDDIIKEVREKPKVAKKRWSGGDIILPIKVKETNGNISTLLKHIEETTQLEFLNWLQQVMPFTESMIKLFVKGNSSNTLEDKLNLFEIVVILHSKKWLFAAGETINQDNKTKWS